MADNGAGLGERRAEDEAAVQRAALQGRPVVSVAKISAEYAGDETQEFTVGLKPNIPVEYAASCTLREPERRDDADGHGGQQTFEESSKSQLYAPWIVTPQATDSV